VTLNLEENCNVTSRPSVLHMVDLFVNFSF